MKNFFRPDIYEVIIASIVIGLIIVLVTMGVLSNSTTNTPLDTDQFHYNTIYTNCNDKVICYNPQNYLGGCIDISTRDDLKEKYCGSKDGR